MSDKLLANLDIESDANSNVKKLETGFTDSDDIKFEFEELDDLSEFFED